MPAFRVIAQTPQGRAVRLSIDADSAAAAMAAVRRRRLFPVIARRAGPPVRPARLRLSRNEMIELLTHLELQTSSDVLIQDAIGVLKARLESRRLRLLLGEVHEYLLSSRGGLSDALAQFPRCFPPDMLAVIAAGEASGSLGEKLAELRAATEFTHDVRRTIKDALRYPLVVSSIALGILAFFVTSTIPRFAVVLHELNVPLPTLTRRVIATAGWCTTWWPFLPVAIAALVVAHAFGRRCESLAVKVDRLLLHVPGYGPLYHHLATALICRTYRSLYLAGCGAVESVEHCARMVSNRALRARLRQARRAIIDGGGLGEAWESSGALPASACAIVSTGESKGHLERALALIAEFYTKTARYRIRALTGLLEPLMIVALGGVVGLVFLALLLPLLAIVKSIK